MFLRKSTINDIKELTAISIKAFDSDIQVGGKEAGGPPDYDSESWYRKMMEQNHLYTFWNIDECIVGDAVLFGAEELFVGRDDESVYYEKRASQSSACTQRAL